MRRTFYLQGVDVVVRDDKEVGHLGAEPAIRVGVCARRDGSEGPPPKVAGGKHDLSGILYGETSWLKYW